MREDRDNSYLPLPVHNRVKTMLENATQYKLDDWEFICVHEEGIKYTTVQYDILLSRSINVVI